MNLSDLKVHLVFDFIDGPWGGGNQFLRALRNEFSNRGVYCEEPNQANIILFNSHHKLDAVMQLRRKFPEKIFIHRIDGPVGLQRGSLNNSTDQELFDTGKLISQGTIFQSNFSFRENQELGFASDNPTAVILNGVDPSIFFPPKHKTSTDVPIQIVSTAWSANPNKGYEVLSYLDSHLDFARFQLRLFSPTKLSFKNIKLCPPLPSPALADQLRGASLYLSCSLYDPCSNAVLEAQACGLRCVLRNSGGHPELARAGDQIFYCTKDILNAIERASSIKDPLPEFSRYISRVGEEYMSFFCEVQNSVKVPNKLSLISHAKYKVRKYAKQLYERLSNQHANSRDYHRRVLLLGDSPESFSSIIAALASQDFTVDLLTFEHNIQSDRAHKIERVHVLDEFSEKNGAWPKQLHDLLARHYYKLLIPTSDRYRTLLYEKRQEILSYCDILFADDNHLCSAIVNGIAK